MSLAGITAKLAASPRDLVGLSATTAESTVAAFRRRKNPPAGGSAATAAEATIAAI